MTKDELLIESLVIIQKQVKEELSAETGDDEISKEIREEYEMCWNFWDILFPKSRELNRFIRNSKKMNLHS